MVWTDERVSTLRQRWADGASGAMIASELGCVSRSAVMGKLLRLGLSGSVTPTRTHTRTPRAPKRRSSGGVKSLKFAKEQPVLAPDPVEPLNVPLAELGPFQCKAVTDATRFAQRYCGHPARLGSVYCEGHHRLHHTRVADKAR